MASDITFEQAYRRLLVHAPELPIPLAKEFINTAYSRVLGYGAWTGTRGETAFTIPTPYVTGTVTMVNGSATVLGVGTTFTSDMVGRQLLVNNIAPFWDIDTFTDATHLELTQPWVGLSGTYVYTICYTYIVMPNDFLSFISVVDTVNNWRVWTNFTQQQIDILDAKRQTTGTPWMLVATNWQDPGTASERIRYELWPRNSGGQTYPVRYEKKLTLVNNSDRPIFPVRGDILIEGALAELALWPGTKDSPNPFSDIALHREHEKRFWKKVFDLEREGQGIEQNWISYGDDTIPYAPLDAAYLQAHGIQF